MTWPNFGGARATGEVSRSLIQKPEMTEKDLTAHQLNDRKSRGPATPAGKPRSALMAPQDENALLMRRMEGSDFRQVSRATSLLMRMKPQERQMEALEQVAENPSGLSF
jgi:hypothetical protein